ncbi:Uncharacterised protein [uncultured archaeon]|nr:Uncharacterised protein [uncultured archaeon]
MGLFDNLFGSSSSEAAPKGSPFAFSYSFRPMRLTGRSNSSVDLLVDLRNASNSPQMCSLVVELPKALGFDGVGLHKTKELRLGTLEAGAQKSLPVSICGTSQTQPGVYRLKVTVYSHYRDYAHVLNSVSKIIELRVV